MFVFIIPEGGASGVKATLQHATMASKLELVEVYGAIMSGPDSRKPVTDSQHQLERGGTGATAASALIGQPELNWQALKTSLGTLNSLGLGTTNGSIVLAGGRLTVDRSLILEAGNGVIRSEAGSSSLLAASFQPNADADAGLDALQLGARQINLTDIQLISGQPGRRGSIDLQAAEELQVQRSTLEGKQLFLRAGKVSVTDNSTFMAPKGLIRLESLNPAQPLSVINSHLDVGVHTLEDLKSPITSVALDNGATIINVEPDPMIGLFSQGDVLVSGSTLNASQILSPLLVADPILLLEQNRNKIQLTDTSGNVVLAANGGIDVRNSDVRADAMAVRRAQDIFLPRGFPAKVFRLQRRQA